ncbi:ABC transporter ATP-binding protein [Streptococcus merionis]|uniref:ABC transporter ATP-binding protein n=1 Tax=Streptococcus merionis TaxID=400065 RepID=UPI0035122609
MIRLLEANKISKRFYLDGQETVEVLTEISLTAHAGEFISILGRSGSGKTTLLKCLSSLLEPSSGTVLLADKNPYRLSDARLSKLRREQIGFIFQHYNLLAALPVFENIILPLKLSGKKVRKEEVKMVLDDMHFKADLAAPIATLSGGEQQKVAIARTILAGNPIIFADEPTGALDSPSRNVIFEKLKDLADQGRCIVMVTHDMVLAAQTDRALILQDGQIQFELKQPTGDQLYQILK